MVLDRMEQDPGARFLLVLAGAVVVIAGMKTAASILVPFTFALFLAVVSMPVLFALRKRGVWSSVAITLTVLLNVLIFGVMIFLVTASLGDLDEKLPRYASAIQALAQRWIGELEERGIPASVYLNLDLISPARVFAAVRDTAAKLASLLSVAFIVGLIMLFILAEANSLPVKFAAISRGGAGGGSGLRVAHIIREVQAYLWLKSLVSLATGVWVTVLCLLADLDFALLLGLIAFALNFVPTIGSIIAAIPGVLLALILYGEVSALLVGGGYVVINVLIGNILDPQIMGNRLGLSTLVVVLSLLFWGWLWGPVGALLSVPLTMVLKIVLQNVPDLRWISILMDKAAPEILPEPGSGAGPIASEAS